MGQRRQTVLAGRLWQGAATEQQLNFIDSRRACSLLSSHIPAPESTTQALAAHVRGILVGNAEQEAEARERRARKSALPCGVVEHRERVGAPSVL